MLSPNLAPSISWRSEVPIPARDKYTKLLGVFIPGFGGHGGVQTAGVGLELPAGGGAAGVEAAQEGGPAGALPALEGEQSAPAAQEQGQEQCDQLAASPAPAASGPGALALFLALRVAAGLAHRAGPQAGAPLMYPFSGAGHILFPASGSVVLYVSSLPFRCDYKIQND